MIIDIDKRQTGKTTRLINHAKEFLLNNEGNILLVTYTLFSSKFLKCRILDLIHYSLLNRKYERKEIDKIKKKLSKRIYYSTSMCNEEEFDFYYVDDFFFIKDHRILLKDNAYYTSLLYEESWGNVLDCYLLVKTGYDDIKILLYDITKQKFKRKYNIEKLFNEDINLYDYVMKYNKNINSIFEMFDIIYKKRVYK